MQDIGILCINHISVHMQDTEEMFPELAEMEDWEELGSGEREEGSTTECDDEDGCQASGDGQDKHCKSHLSMQKHSLYKYNSTRSLRVYLEYQLRYMTKEVSASGETVCFLFFQLSDPVIVF